MYYTVPHVFYESVPVRTPLPNSWFKSLRKSVANPELVDIPATVSQTIVAYLLLLELNAAAFCQHRLSQLYSDSESVIRA